MRTNRTKLQLIGLITALALTSSAFMCNGYAKAGELSRDFAAGVQAFQSSEIVFHNAGKVSDEEHAVIQDWLIRVANAGQQLDTAINTTHNSKDAKAAVNAAIDATSNLLNTGVLGVKNPDSKAALQASLITLKSILGSILALGGH